MHWCKKQSIQENPHLMKYRSTGNKNDIKFQLKNTESAAIFLYFSSKVDHFDLYHPEVN